MGGERKVQKIAIIGGGPAGLTAAIEAAKSGLSVTLFEQFKIGENIRCAEGFFDTLNMLGKPKYGVRFKVEELELEIKSKYVFPCDNQTNIWMIDRREWQKGLADEARALGVNIIENSSITKKRFIELVWDYDWIIDSSGALSITSQVHGFNKYYKDTSAITVQYALEGDFSEFYGKIKLVLDDPYTGYYWIFPKSKYEANVGLGVFKSTKLNLWDKLDKVLEKEGISSYKKIKKLGGICPTVKFDRLVYDNVLLAGDAAGLVSPLHGGGIDTACISGKIAVQSILYNRVDCYERDLSNILDKKLKGEKELFNLLETLNSGLIDHIIRIVHRSGKTLGEYGVLNGRTHKFLQLGFIQALLHTKKK